MDAPQTLDAMADGRLPGRSLLGLERAQLDALVDQALFSAEHGRVEQARDLMAALADVEPDRPILALLLGHLEAQSGQHEAALAAYSEAAARLGTRDADRPRLAADIELARAEVELVLGDPEAARPRLNRVRSRGSSTARARAKALEEGIAP